MRYERSTLRVGAFAVLALLAVGTVLAAPPGRLAQPRITKHGFYKMDPTPGLMPLGIGKPASLAHVEAWVTSDLVVDDFSTYPFWYDSENLEIFLAFYNVRSVNTNIQVQIKDESGATVFNGTDSDIFEPDAIIGGTVEVGTLTPGAYKVIVKIKQGTKVVGQQFWMLVFADPGP